MATNLSEPPGQPPGVKASREKSRKEITEQNASMETEDEEQTKDSSTEAKDQSTESKKRKIPSNDSEDEADKSESLDDLCRKKFKPIAPKPFLKKDQHQSVMMTAVPVKEGAAEKIEKGSSNSTESDSPTKGGAVIFMGPNMQLYPSAPFIVQPPPLVPCSGSVGGAFSYAMPTPVGHFMPHVAHIPGYCPSGQYQCCVRLPPPVIEGRDYYVNEMRPSGKQTKDESEVKVTPKSKSQSTVTQSSKESSKSKASRYKYSILYNGPIYKGAAPSPQQSSTSTTPMESFVPTTESDNAGNIKLNLSAVLTSTGVLQITVPSLMSIDPKQTSNPSAFPQIKLQTVHGAALTPGVLPTVMNPQHHPNSGHVVVVSAAQNQGSRPLPSRVSLPSSAVSKTTASVLATVVSNSSRLSSNTTRSSASNSSPSSQPVVSNSTTSSTVFSNSNPKLVVSIAGSDHQRQSQNKDFTKSSSMPTATTTVPSLLSTNITNMSNVSSVVTVAHVQVPSKIPTSVQETDLSELINVKQKASRAHDIRTKFDITSGPSELHRTSQVSETNEGSGGERTKTAQVRDTTLDNHPSGETSVSGRHSAGMDMAEQISDMAVNRLASAPTNINRLVTTHDTIVNTLPSVSNNNRPVTETNSSTPISPDHVAHSTEENHTSPVDNAHHDITTAQTRNHHRTLPSGNQCSGIDIRWRPNSTINHPDTPRSAQELTREGSSALACNQNRVDRTQGGQIASTQAGLDANITTVPTMSTSVSPTLEMTRGNSIQDTMTESHHTAIPRSSGRADISSEQTQQTISSRHVTSNPPSIDLNPAMAQRNNTGMNSKDNVPSHNVGRNHNIGGLKQSSLGHIQQQRQNDNRPSIGPDLSHPPPVPNTVSRRPPLPADVPSTSRNTRGLFQSSTSQHIANPERSNLTAKPTMPESSDLASRRNLTVDSSRVDINANRRSSDIRGHGKEFPHQAVPNCMPQQNSSTTPSTSNRQFSTAQTSLSAAPDVPSMNPQQPRTYSTSHAERQTEEPQVPPVVCVTPGNEFIRPVSSSHRWPQMSASTNRPPVNTTIPSTQGSYTSAVQSVARNYAPNPSNNNAQTRQAPPSQEQASSASMNQAFTSENRNLSSSQNYNSMQGPPNTLRPWQSSSNDAGTSTMSSAYGGLGQRDRSSSSSGLSGSQSYVRNDLQNRASDRFRSSSVSGNMDKELGPSSVQSVPLFSNVPANTRPSMNDTRRSSRALRPPHGLPDNLQRTSSSSNSNASGRLHSEQGDSQHRSRFDSSLITPEKSQASISHLHSESDHIGHSSGGSSGILHSDPMSRFSMPIVHPMLYGNSPSVPGMGSLHHGVPPHLAGSFGGQRHGPPHLLTPPPTGTHHTPSRPTPHSHNHMFVAPPYASMHRPLYMPATSPRPPDLGLMSPRAYSHVHDSGLYSPRFQSMQSADSILTSHLARTFSDEHLDTCCSHAHSPPVPSPTSRHILPPRFSSPPAASLGSHPLPLPPSSTPRDNVSQRTFQGSSHTVMPSDIFGSPHLESIPVTTQAPVTTTTSPSVPTPLTIQTNLNSHTTNPRSASSTSSNVPSEGRSTVTPTGSAHNSPPSASPLPARSFMGNTSDKYLPLEDAPPTPGSASGVTAAATPALNNDQIVKFGDVSLDCSRQILRESGRTVLCCWHCDYHSAEPKKMYRHQKKDTKEMKCQLCDFKGYSRCAVSQHFKEKHNDKL